MNKFYALSAWAMIASFGIASSSLAYTTHIQTTEKDAQSKSVSFTFKLDKDEIIYKDSLQFTNNNPHITLTAPTTSQEIVSKFDPSFNETKEGYLSDVTFTVIAHNDNTSKDEESTIQAHFLISSSKKPQIATAHISFLADKATNKVEIQPLAKTVDAHTTSSHESAAHGIMQKISHTISQTTQKWYLALTSLFEDTGSYWLRYILALLLGLLLSLTPCIYPMIPVTVGVLQANKSSSSLKNFILALAYTVGISITFATIGFITALSSSVFGQLQTSPWVILPVVLVLIYLGLSMFGLYEMYIPKFMQPKTNIKGGSITSAFIFGAISGTVASPCLSPGLALIITYVHKITQAGSALSYLHGFLLLFAFGIGTSLPLLIIGTFSSSLNVLPKAGMWMIEIKRILGLMLIAMAFYYMQNIIAWPILLWIITAFLFIIGMYYFADIKGYDSTWTRRYKYLIGTFLIVASCYTSFLGVKSMYNTAPTQPVQEHLFLGQKNYADARAQAIAQNKRLFLDFSTSWCAACKKLDKDVLSRADVQNALQEYVAIKVDATDPLSEPYAHLQQPLHIKGFPTLVVLDPKDESAITTWLGYVTNVDQFIKELNHYSK